MLENKENENNPGQKNKNKNPLPATIRRLTKLLHVSEKTFILTPPKALTH